MKTIAETNFKDCSSRRSSSMEGIPSQPSQLRRLDNVDVDDLFEKIDKTKIEVEPLVDIFIETARQGLGFEEFKRFAAESIRSKSFISTKAQNEPYLYTQLESSEIAAVTCAPENMAQDSGAVYCIIVAM